MPHAIKHLGLIIIIAVGLSTLAIAQQEQDSHQQHEQKHHEQEQQALASIYDNVLQKNANIALNSCQQLATTLQQSTAGVRSQTIDEHFKDLALNWKKVEATYIAGDFDVHVIDTPRYIDIFHIGNENIHEQMQKVLSSHSKPEVALFKNSYKTINALEVVLYQDEHLNQRDLHIAHAISQHICQHLDTIKRTYQHKRADYLNQPKLSLSKIINTLANQSHFLKEWRIADVAGLSKKYQNNPDKKRAEFYLSGLSVNAIDAILQAQSELIDQQDYSNLVDITQLYHAQKPLHDNQKLLKDARHQIQHLTIDELTMDNHKSTQLYDTIHQLQIGYYQHLIHALPIQPVILEADGD